MHVGWWHHVTVQVERELKVCISLIFVRSPGEGLGCTHGLVASPNCGGIKTEIVLPLSLHLEILGRCSTVHI